MDTPGDPHESTVDNTPSPLGGRIALVTDSTCDLPGSARLRYGLTSVPLHVTLGDATYLDGVDLDASTFYERFREAGQMAKSSQPSVGEFEEVYRALLEEHDVLVSVHISARLSGTLESAAGAAQRVGSERVRVVDSRHVSVGLGLVVRAAGEAILAGETPDDVVAAAQAAVAETRVYGALPSLDAAVRGGRLSPGAARVAGAIELKPLVVFDKEGSVHVDGARLGYTRALRAVAGRVAHYAGDEGAQVAIVHADGLESARRVRDRLQGLLGHGDIPILEAGPVITTHVGLGTVAVAVRPMAAGTSAPEPSS